MSPLVRARKLPVRRATPSDSDIGTQMMKGRWSFIVYRSSKEERPRLAANPSNRQNFYINLVA